jgi:Flp pilus assembly pilin Flp
MRHVFPRVSALAATQAHRFTIALATLRARSEGQGLVEYGLILVLIMVVCVSILTLTGSTISEVWYTRLLGRMP